jgi:uncharacterized protein YndB with AHSA1/START domain
MIHVCPTDVVAAPAERIWGLLTEPEALPTWSGTTLAEGPGRSMAVGDRIVLRKGPFRIVWDVLAMEPPRQLTMDVRLPFGMVNHEVVVISDLGAGRCRVTLN